MDLLRVLSGQFEDRILNPLMDVVDLLSKEITDKAKQRAASEIVAGLIRGSKHWTEAKCQRLWNRVLPAFTFVMNSSTMEILGFWIEALNYACVSEWNGYTYN